jgi:Icc-related predicted phosphoesterase
MKLYATADIHGAQHRINLILDNIKKYTPDLVVICGDITQFGPGEQATSFLNQIPIEVFAIPGNIDTADVYQGITNSKATNLHQQLVSFEDVPFVGIGGELDNAFPELPITADKKTLSVIDAVTSDTILVTHVPPYGLQDKVYMGRHIGSKEVRDLVDMKHPRLVLSGHVHENPGVTTYKHTVVVNTSMGKRTEGAIITVTDAISVEILE